MHDVATDRRPLLYSITFSTAPAGMDFYICLERPGYRVARRRKQKTRVGVQHKVTKDDAIKWWVAGWLASLGTALPAEQQGPPGTENRVTYDRHG